MVTRLSGGLTPADGADPRTFPAIWNSTAGTIESQGSAIAVLEGDSIPTNVASPVSGDSLVYDGTDWVNGPRSGNAIINGDFGVWQRGTSFTAGYTADRWNVNASGGTLDVSRGSFSPADLEVIGYGDAKYYFDYELTAADDNANFSQPIEDVRTFAGQTVTLSFWAKSVSNVDILIQLRQDFGPGGSGDAVSTLVNTQSISSSWTRYSFTATLPSVSGKTIVDGSFLNVFFVNPANETWDMQVWGVQLEAGSVATPFRLAGGGSKAAELALCQRYYYRRSSQSNFNIYGAGAAFDGTSVLIEVKYAQTMRAVASLGSGGTFALQPSAGGISGIALSRSGLDSAALDVTVSSTSSGNAHTLRDNNDATAFLEFDAEL